MKPFGACLGCLLVWTTVHSLPAAADQAQIFGKDRRVVEVVIPVETEPFDMASSPDGKTLWVTQVGAGKLSAIEQNKVVRSAAVGARPTGLAVNAAGDTLYVGLGGESALAVVDAKTLAVKRKIPVGSFPVGVALSPDERFVLVTCATDGTIHLVSTASWESGRVVVGGTPYFSILSKDGKLVITSNLSSGQVHLTRLELDAGPLAAGGFHLTPYKSIAVGASPVGLALSLDGERLYVANYGGASVSVLSTRIWAVEQTLAVGTQPYWIAVHPKDGFLLVSNWGSSFVDVIYPDGRRAFTTNYTGNQIAVIE